MITLHPGARHSELVNADLLAKLRTNQTSFDPGHPGVIHEQVHVEHRHRQAWVDEGVAPLIEHLWQHGIDTFGSCENVCEWMPQVIWPWMFVKPDSPPVAFVTFSVKSHRRMVRLFDLPNKQIGRDTVAVQRLFRIDATGFVLLDDDELVHEMLPENFDHLGD